RGAGMLAAMLLASATAAGLLAASRTTPHPRDGGRIEGTVVISRALSARPLPFRPSAEPGAGAQAPKPQAPDSVAELRNVVIYVDGSKAFPLGALPGAEPPPPDSM